MTIKSAILFTQHSNTLTSADVYQLCSTKLADNSRDYNSIFFYFDSVNILNQDEYFAHWQQLKDNFCIDLIACSTVATNRHINTTNTGPFELAGLSEFYSRLHHCDELVQM